MKKGGPTFARLSSLPMFETPARRHAPSAKGPVHEGNNGYQRDAVDASAPSMRGFRYSSERGHRCWGRRQSGPGSAAQF